jgi:hypothetical protein
MVFFKQEAALFGLDVLRDLVIFYQIFGTVVI